MDIITPRVLKGFRDFLPQAEIVRLDLTEKIEKSFRSFGFVPIDTPALEYADILLGKGGGDIENDAYAYIQTGSTPVDPDNPGKAEEAKQIVKELCKAHPLYDFT